ncbi:basic secretory family protein [Niabella hibiscisoli]|nr:basic secretory family protein [Niabella hibiscisoli]
MIETFFKVYPQEAKLYNKNTRKLVTFVIDPEYTAVAAASGGVIKVNPEWMIKNPEDLDVVTHEAMHIVQSYPGWAGPGWITEGIADYVRHKLGVNNAASKWSLPALTDKHKYTDAYRVTARFFVWVEKTIIKRWCRNWIMLCELKLIPKISGLKKPVKRLMSFGIFIKKSGNLNMRQGVLAIGILLISMASIAQNKTTFTAAEYVNVF